jgi:hypothetical protein
MLHQELLRYIILLSDFAYAARMAQNIYERPALLLPVWLLLLFGAVQAQPTLPITATLLEKE